MKFTELLRQMPDFIGGKGGDEETIIAYENALGTRFAPDYREYLKEIGLACFDGKELTGISKTSRLNVVDVTKEEREMNDGIPADFYVIEETCYDGIVIWQASNGFVFKTTPNTKPQKVGRSLADFYR